MVYGLNYYPYNFPHLQHLKVSDQGYVYYACDLLGTISCVRGYGPEMDSIFLLLSMSS